MKQAISQDWWAPEAALLAVCDALIGVWIITSEQNPGSIVGGTFFILGGVAIVGGLAQRPRNRSLGTGLILFGAFWGLPLSWLVLPPILGLVVMVGVLTSSNRS